MLRIPGLLRVALFGPLLACTGGSSRLPLAATPTADTASAPTFGPTAETGAGADTSWVTTDTAAFTGRFDTFVTVTEPPPSSSDLSCWAVGSPLGTTSLDPANRFGHRRPTARWLTSSTLRTEGWDQLRDP